MKQYWRYNKEALNETHAMKKQAYCKWRDQSKPRESDIIVFIEYNTAKRNLETSGQASKRTKDNTVNDERS